MIRLLHNGQERALDPTGHATLGDALQAHLDEGADRRVLVSVRVDGAPLAPEQLQQPGAVPLGTVRELEVESRAAHEVAHAALDSAAAYLVQVERALARTGLLFRSGEIEQANGLYADVLDALSLLVFALGAAARELGDAAQSLAGVEQEASRWVRELLDAQGRQDWVGVADILEYELAPLLDDWAGRLRGLTHT